MSLALPELKKKRDLLLRREQLRRDNGILYYKPHPKQDMFHRAGAYKGRYVRTGNRFGKSELGAAEDIAWCLGYRSWYPEGDPARYEGIPQHPVKLLLVVTDWPKSTEIFTSQEAGDRRGKLFSLIPKDKLVGGPHRNHSGAIDMIRIKSKWGGTSLLYIDTMQSYKQNPLGAESSDWDAIHVDEPISQKFWRAISRGLIDRNGKYWFTCTPLSEMWINDLFIPTERLRDLFDKPFIDGTKWMVTGSIYDNPYISKEAADEFLDGSMSEAERECRQNGIPTALSGIIFKQFDPAVGGKHVKDFRKFKGWNKIGLPPKDHTIYLSIDPHMKTEHAVLFCAVNALEQKFVYKEMFKPGTIKELCRQMGFLLEGRRPYQVVCDPIAWMENQVTGTRMCDEFYQSGFNVEPASKELDYGILKTQEALESDEWYFDEGLKETRWEFDHYAWHPEKEKPVDEDDHMMECFRRLVMIKPRHRPDVDKAPREIMPTDFTTAPMDTPSTRDMMRFDHIEPAKRIMRGVDDSGIPYTEIRQEFRHRN